MADLMVFLHLLSAIVGFGSVTLAGVYGNDAMAKGGSEGLAIFDSSYKVAEKIATMFIYATAVFGIAAVLTSDGFEFEQTWIAVSLGIYLAALVFSHALHRPGLKEMRRLLAAQVEGDDVKDDLEKTSKRVAATGTTLDLSLVVILWLMVTKPS